MRLPNSYGAVIKLKGKRRKPFAIRKTVGYNSDGSQIRKFIGYYATRNEALQELALFNENPYDIEYKSIKV